MRLTGFALSTCFLTSCARALPDHRAPGLKYPRKVQLNDSPSAIVMRACNELSIERIHITIRFMYVNNALYTRPTAHVVITRAKFLHIIPTTFAVRGVEEQVYS